MSKQKQNVDPPTNAIPHSWRASKWPAHVYPNEQHEANNLVRFFRADLQKARALTRIGRRLVVRGPQYEAWMEANIDNVESFQPTGAARKKRA